MEKSWIDLTKEEKQKLLKEFLVCLATGDSNVVLLYNVDGYNVYSFYAEDYYHNVTLYANIPPTIVRMRN